MNCGSAGLSNRPRATTPLGHHQYDMLQQLCCVNRRRQDQRVVLVRPDRLFDLILKLCASSIQGSNNWHLERGSNFQLVGLKELCFTASSRISPLMEAHLYETVSVDAI